MRSPVLVIILLIVVAGMLPPAPAQSPRMVQISNPSALQPDDSMDWLSATRGQINVYFAGPFKIRSHKGKLVQIGGPQEFQAMQWKEWHLHNNPSGPYVPSPDAVLLSSRFGTYRGHDGRYEGVPPISFEFSTPITGVGMRIISWEVSTPPRMVLGFPRGSRLTVTVRAFGDADHLLASFSSVSEGSNPVYVGVLSGQNNIHRVEISSDTDYPELAVRKHVANNFLIGRVALSTGERGPCCDTISPNSRTVAMEPISTPPVTQSPNQPAAARNLGSAVQTTSAQPPRQTPPSGPSVTASPVGAPLNVAAVSQGKAEVKIGGVFYTLSTDKAEYGPDEPVNLRFTVTNSGNSPAKFEFGSAQQYDFQVLNGTAQIMRWSSGQTFDKAKQTLTLAPGGALIYSTNWSQKNPDQEVIAAGDYQIKGVFLVAESPVEISLMFRRLAPTSPASSASTVQPSSPPSVVVPATPSTPTWASSFSPSGPPAQPPQPVPPAQPTVAPVTPGISVRPNAPLPLTSAPPAPSSAPTPPTHAPAPPTPAAAPAPHAAATPPQQRANVPTAFAIQPGLRIGPLTLGMSVQALEAKLGPSKGVQKAPDGTSVYRWFEPPKNAGIGARIAQDGMVQRMWILNDGRYATGEGLHIGSTEAEVRSVLGTPSAVVENPQDKTRTLRYGNLGLWVTIQLDKRFIFYNQVFDIGVMPKQ